MAARKRLTEEEERKLYDLVLQLLADVQALREEVAIVKARVTARPPAK
jgi:hypothetical protein